MIKLVLMANKPSTFLHIVYFTLKRAFDFCFSLTYFQHFVLDTKTRLNFRGFLFAMALRGYLRDNMR